MFDFPPVNPMSEFFGMGFHLIGLALYGLFALVSFIVVVGIVVLLVRFLLIATRAAQLYVVKNSPAAGDVPTAKNSPAATQNSATTKPATQPRTRKAPPES